MNTPAALAVLCVWAMWYLGTGNYRRIGRIVRLAARLAYLRLRMRRIER